MAAFGPTFARRVEAPLARAKVELGAGRVKEALEALEPQRLAAALRAGLDDVARESGASRALVESLLEWDPIDKALAALGESRGAAAMVWAELPPITGGLLAGVAEVTTHLENDDVGFYLDRLADKMSRDRSLAGPIDQLAVDVDNWQRLTIAATSLLDEHPRLLAARRARTFSRAAVVLGLAAIVVPTSIALLLAWRARAAARDRVEVALLAEDPCLAASIEAADLETAGAAAQARVADRAAACKAVRARAARESACEALVRDVEEGRPPEGAGAEVAGESLALLGRVAKKQLAPADLSAAPRWPCDELGAPPRLWRAFVAAAGENVLLWRDPPPLADEVATKIAEQGLAPIARGTLLGRAEETSGHGVRQGDATSLVRGAELCDLARRLKIETGPNCRGLDVVRAKSPHPR